MAYKTLLVDDDENVLQGYYRALRKQFTLEVALGGPQALQALAEHGPFAVIVADMGMPAMTGIEVLQQARRLAPDTTRIMLTGYSDQKTAVDAVNEGQVFRFLSKPCPADQLAIAIEAGIRHHQLVVAERELLQQTLVGSIEVLSELLSGLDPEASRRSQLLRERMRPLARALAFEDEWTLEAAAMLAFIGRLALPPEALAKLHASASLSPKERLWLERSPEAGARLLHRIPRMEAVAEIIRYQAKGFDGSGFPEDEVAGERIPLGARILKALGDFTETELARQSRPVALEELALHRAKYDPKVLEALFQEFGSPFAAPPAQERALGVAGLEAGMVLVRDVRTDQGRLVLMTGQRLGPGHLEMLHNLAELLGLQEPVFVQES
jgi:response regulator RpfG family c-di-GMP phosphodiesterase